MITGTYPCCDAPLMIPLPDVPLPVIGRETCQECGAKVYHLFSRVEPQSWTEKGFFQNYKINSEGVVQPLSDEEKIAAANNTEDKI